MWAVIAAGANAVRLGGMGTVLGFDWPSIVMLGEARGVPRADLLHFLPMAEAGMLDAIEERYEREEVRAARNMDGQWAADRSAPRSE